MRHALLAAALLTVSAPAGAAPPAEPEPVRAVAVLRDGAGRQVGTVTLAQDLNGVRIAVGVKGLAPGRHGFAIHETGRCEGPGFESAGGRFDPARKGRGAASPAGDLPALAVSAEGTAQVGFIAKGVSLEAGAASLLGGAGTALVLERGGARIACGVVTRR